MSFNSIKGHDGPIRILQSYMRQSHLEGGYLFTGPQGIGKRLVAKTLAKAVNCESLEFDSCEQCPSCLKIEHYQHPDVHPIEKDASEIKIEEIRQLKKEISLRPYEGRRKIFIIDNAHKMNAESSNALLKILEEPPKMSLIVLITDKPTLLFKTIISRCKILKFSCMPRQKLEDLLKKEYKLNDNLAHFLAYFCEGRLGFALSLKDRDLLREKNRIINEFALSRRIQSQGLSLENREEVRGYLNILSTWFRDIYLIKADAPQYEIINIDRWAELSGSMRRFSFSQLDEILNLISESILYLEQNINVRLMLHNLGAQLWKV